HFILPALREASGYQLRYNIRAPHLTLAGIYKAMGKPMLAMEHMEQAIRLSDSLVSKEKIQAVNLLDVTLQTSEKDKELLQNRLRLLQQDNKLKEKNSWILIVSAISGMLCILLLLLYRSTLQKRKLQEQVIQNLNKEQEIIQLRALMQGEE